MCPGTRAVRTDPPATSNRHDPSVLGLAKTFTAVPSIFPRGRRSRPAPKTSALSRFAENLSNKDDVRTKRYPEDGSTGGCHHGTVPPGRQQEGHQNGRCAVRVKLIVVTSSYGIRSNKHTHRTHGNFMDQPSGQARAGSAILSRR